MIVAIWFAILLLLGLWTLGAWALASLLGGDSGWVDRVQMWLVNAPFGDWLDLWLPGWMMAVQASLDALQDLLAWMGGAVPLLVWGVWALGALALLALAGALTLLVRLVRRSTAPAPRSAPAA